MDYIVSCPDGPYDPRPAWAKPRDFDNLLSAERSARSLARRYPAKFHVTDPELGLVLIVSQDAIGRVWSDVMTMDSRLNAKLTKG